MNEVTGKLLCKKAKSGIERQLTALSLKGKLTPYQVPLAQLAGSLKSFVGEVEVHFEFQAGQPCRIRPVGEAWVVAVAPAVRGSMSTGQARPTPREFPHEFHNPYNFIPTARRDNVEGELGDRSPCGHDRYHPGHFSGRIGVKITVKSPLIIPDASRSVKDDNGHSSFPLKVGLDGRPDLPVTSVKGVLRSSYEAITNSRLAVFQKHEARLAHRQEAKIDSFPARIERGPTGTLRVRLLSKLWNRSPAKLPCYEKRSGAPDKGRTRVGLRYTGTSRFPEHGDHVWVRVTASGYTEEIRQHAGTPKPGTDWDEGWVCITGANIGGKRSERVFVTSPADTFVAADGLAKQWGELIADYQETNRRALERREADGIPFDRYLGDKPLQTGWSRHVYERNAAQFAEGLLCYVKVERGIVVGIYPVTISRQLFNSTPAQLLDNTLKPATSLDQLSPADRLFGWVNPRGKGAYAGKVRIGPIRCETPPEQAIDEFGDPGVPLAILGQPKPQQVGFYIRSLNETTPNYVQDKNELRGRKVYPHHRGPTEDHWKDPIDDRTQVKRDGHYQEYRRPKNAAGGEVRDDQNRSIQAWVRPETTFVFSIEVINLSPVELGGLLWLLNLPPDHFHRLGGAKPLGFGSVRLDLEGLDVRDGEALVERYRTLEEPAAEVGIHWIKDNAVAVITTFKDEVQRAYGKPFEDVPFIAAFLRAAQGFEDALPIHYPRARSNNETGHIPPNLEGKNFEWFVANNKVGGPHLELPKITEDRGFPILPQR